MNWFFGFSHVTFLLPFISVICTNPLGTFRCWDTDTYRGLNGGRFQRELAIYMQGEFITFCLEGESFLLTPLEQSIENSLCYRTKYSLTYYFKITHNLSTIKYLLSLTSSSTFVFVIINTAYCST